MCTELLPTGGYPIAVKYIISYRHISYHIISYHIISYHISYQQGVETFGTEITAHAPIYEQGNCLFPTGVFRKTSETDEETRSHNTVTQIKACYALQLVLRLS